MFGQRSFGAVNGDLVVNPKSQQIMPPPPNIEQMLQNSIDFIQWHIRMLLATESHKRSPGGGPSSCCVSARATSRTHVPSCELELTCDEGRTDATRTGVSEGVWARSGVALVAAKSYYFGVGGSVAQFRDLVERGGLLEHRGALTIEDGSSNRREVLELCWKT